MQTNTKVVQGQKEAEGGGQVTLLEFDGDISSASRDAVLGTYEALSRDEHKKILLDFAKVKYLNSSGIALVIQALIAASKAGQTIGISGLTPHFTKVFTMVGITKYAALYPDQAAALRSM